MKSLTKQSLEVIVYMSVCHPEDYRTKIYLRKRLAKEHIPYFRLGSFYNRACRKVWDADGGDREYISLYRADCLDEPFVGEKSLCVYKEKMR